MRKHWSINCLVRMFGLALGWTLIASSSLRAGQIATIVDRYGHTVYVNSSEVLPSGRFQSLRRRSIPTPSPEITKLVNKTADRYQVDPELVQAIIQVESDYDPHAVSSKGAMGLMQLVPSTAARFGVQNPFNPKQNIEGGVTYLKYLLGLFGGNIPLSLAAYNAGENAVLRTGGIPSYLETRNYVRKVTAQYQSGASARPPAKESARLPIYRYVDKHGIVHFSNVD